MNKPLGVARMILIGGVPSNSTRVPDPRWRFDVSDVPRIELGVPIPACEFGKLLHCVTCVDSDNCGVALTRVAYRDVGLGCDVLKLRKETGFGALLGAQQLLAERCQPSALAALHRNEGPPKNVDHLWSKSDAWR